MFLNIIDAQTQAVDAVISRKALESQLALLNDQNDPTKTLRLALKNEIKAVQTILDDANVYLNQNFIKPLRYQSSIVNDQGQVSTLWDNESEISNTVKSYLATLPQRTVAESQITNTTIDSNVANASMFMKEKQVKLDAVKKVSDSNPLKTTLLNEAQVEFDLATNNFNDFLRTKESFSVAATRGDTIINQDAESKPVDSFSQGIRSAIQNSLNNKTGNKNALDLEAAISMRKKALDALYSAKTPEEKQAAQERLNRTAAAISSPDPIVRTVFDNNPNQLDYLINELDTINDQVTELSASLQVAEQQLAAAIAGGNPTEIAAAQANYDAVLASLNSAKYSQTLINDTLLGFRDSPVPLSMYPGSTQTTQFDPHKIDAPTDPEQNANKETIEVIKNNQIKNSGNLAPDDTVYDTQTARFVLVKNAKFSESGRYIVNRLPTTEEHENYEFQIAQQKIKKNYEIQSAGVTQQKASNNESLATFTADKNTEKRNNEIQISELSSQLDDLDSNDPAYQAINNQILDIQNKNSLIDQEIQTATELNSRNNSQLDSTLFDLNAETQTTLAAREKQRDDAINSSQVSASQDEARAVIENFSDSKAAADNAENNFNKSLTLAQQRAYQNDPNKDPTDPANWSEQDRENVQTNLDRMNTAREGEVDAAVRFDNYATTVPGGADTLRQVGLSDAEINQQVTEAQDIRVDKTNEPFEFSKKDLGNAANSIDSSNIRAVNGFEQLNDASGGAPFYLQMPTLKSISDFHLPNGISPYGKRTQDEVARDAIHFQIFEITPPAARAVLAPGSSGLIRNQVDPAKSNTIGTFTIYPNNPDHLSISHEHQYSNESTIASAANDILGIVDGADSALTLLSSGVTSLLKGREEGIPQKFMRKVDTIDYYVDTPKQEMAVDFVLFTKKDFLQDVFRPLMFLTALSYPKRSLTGNFGASIAKLGRSITDGANGKGNLPISIQNLLSLAQKSGIDIKNADAVSRFINETESKLSETGGVGPYRYFVTKRPEYISVRHASGLFYYPLAVITGVSYNFKGPWYNYNGNPISANGNLEQLMRAGLSQYAQDPNVRSFTESFQSIFGQTNGTLSNMVGLNPTDPLIQRYRLPYAYPSYATCTVTIRSALPLFRDDYLSLFYGAGESDGGANIVTVTQNQTGFVKDPNKSKAIF